jgi:hypothetical protein
MKYNLNIHHRRSIRLQEYDYSQAGAYFVTICTHQKECLLGEIVDGEMRLNQFGDLVKLYWQNLSKHYSYLQLDEFVVMPNHLHGILVLCDDRGDGAGFDDRLSLGNEDMAKPAPTSAPLVTS